MNPAKAKMNGNGRTSPLPDKALKLARRAKSLDTGKNGRFTLELITTVDGRWLLIVNGGQVEDLGTS